MADNYIQDFMARIVAMQIEALAGYDPPLADAKPFWPYQHSVFPYTTNRPATATYDYTAAPSTEDMIVITRNVTMRLVVAHVTAGVLGEIPDLTLQYIESMETYFLNHPGLTTDAGSYTDEPDYLWEEDEALIISDTGLVIFDNRGLVTAQFGVEFTLAVPYLREINQA